MASDGDQPHHRPNGGVRARLLQEDLDRRIATVQKEIELRLAAVEAMRAYLVAELDRRFDGMRREVDQRFDSTIHMRMALQEEMDRRFTDLSSQLDRRFIDSERAVQAALAAAKEAVLKAEESANERFKAVNEFRGQLADQAATLLSRNEYAVQYRALGDTVTQLRQDLTRVDGMVVPRSENESWRTQISEKLSDSSKVASDRISALELRITSRLDLGAGQNAGEDTARAEMREYEALSFAKRQAAVASPLRANLASGIATLAVLISFVVLILDLTGKK
jgi:hypothetical protein